MGVCYVVYHQSTVYISHPHEYETSNIHSDRNSVIAQVFPFEPTIPKIEETACVDD
jgi:hypothetical protein